MNKIVKVKLWGTLIGALGYSEGQSEIATFEYDKEFVKMGIEVSPLKVPIKNLSYTFDDISKRTFHGLAGFIADSLPDKFGNQLIDQYFALKGKNVDDITALDRLLYIGNRGMGALEFEPSEKFENTNSFNQLNLHELSELAEMILSKKEQFKEELANRNNRQSAINLLKIGSSAGGARSKALVAIDKDGKIYDGTINQTIECDYYLIKFDSSLNSDRDNIDPKGMTKVEYIYSLIAKECDINMSRTDYIIDDDDFHFLIKRFDRVKKDNKIEKLHYVSWCGMSHAHRDYVGAYSYEQLVSTSRQLGLGQDSITEIFKRAVFNVIGRNHDDHTKNFGFLMDDQGKWSLSPAFDMTYSYDPTGKWTNKHQINLNTKSTNFTFEDIISFGKYCNLSSKKATDILRKTKKAFSNFENLANEYEVSNDLKNTILNNLRMSL